jgi:hypothetical protein
MFNFKSAKKPRPKTKIRAQPELKKFRPDPPLHSQSYMQLMRNFANTTVSLNSVKFDKVSKSQAVLHRVFA